jgi:hypothetical protein
MKPMSLLVCGIVLSSLGAAITVHAESSAGNFALRANTVNTQASPRDWRKEPVRGSDMTETAPRGDSRAMHEHGRNRIAEVARLSTKGVETKVTGQAHKGAGRPRIQGIFSRWGTLPHCVSPTFAMSTAWQQ